MDEIKILRCSECFQNRGLKLATIMPSKNLNLLDLGVILIEENVAEFESLDMALHRVKLLNKEKNYGKKFLFKLTVTALLSFSSFECVASEAILKGLEIAVPRARRLLSSLMTPDDLLKGLERAAPKAKLILENCTTKLPDEFLLVRNSSNNLSGTVLQFRKMVADTPREEQRAFVSTFYGSSLDRSIRNELDQIRAVANRDPRIYDLDAYKNVEKISDDLGIE